MAANSTALQSAYATLHIDSTASYRDALEARDTLIARYAASKDAKTSSMNAARSIAIRNAFKTVCRENGWNQESDGGNNGTTNDTTNGTSRPEQNRRDTEDGTAEKTESSANARYGSKSNSAEAVKEEFRKTAKAANAAAATARRNAQTKRAALRKTRDSDRRIGQRRYDSILSNKTLKLMLRIAILIALIAMGTRTATSYHGMLPGIVTGTLTIIEAVSGKFSAFAVAGMARTARGYYRYIRWFAIPIARFSKKTAKRIVKTARKAIGRR